MKKLQFIEHLRCFCSDKIKNNNFPQSSHQTTWHFISFNRSQTFCHCNRKEREREKKNRKKIMRMETLQHNIIMDNKIAIHSSLQISLGTTLYSLGRRSSACTNIRISLFYFFNKKKDFTAEAFQVYRIVRSGKTHICTNNFHRNKNRQLLFIIPWKCFPKSTKWYYSGSSIS